MLESEIEEARSKDRPQKTVIIYVEGTPHEWPKNDKITFAEVVTLEVPDRGGSGKLDRGYEWNFRLNAA